MKVVDADYVVTLADQALAEMRSEKSRSSSDHNALFCLARVYARQVAGNVEHD
jgi:hypothetical protein